MRRYSLRLRSARNCNIGGSKNKNPEHGMRLVAAFSFAALLAAQGAWAGKTNGLPGVDPRSAPARISTLTPVMLDEGQSEPARQSRWGTFTNWARTISPS